MSEILSDSDPWVDRLIKALCLHRQSYCYWFLKILAKFQTRLAVCRLCKETLVAEPLPSASVFYVDPMSELPGEFEEQPIVWSDEAVRISQSFREEASLQGDS